MLQRIKLFHIFTIFTLGLGMILSGCNTTTDSGNSTPEDVTVQFITPTTSNSKAISSTGKLKQVNDTLTIEGSNGLLVIHDLRFIVEDFKLEREEGECDDLEGEDNENCEEFEYDSFFVDLPLQGDTLNLDTSSILPGLYKKLEFEVDDLDLDDEGEEEKEEKQELVDQVLGEFPDWPEEVSMVILGTFISSEGDTTDFKTYAKAELEIEMEFNPPLEVGENTINKLLRINIDPQAWFLNNDGTVRDLSEYDYDTTGEILEFEVEIEDGFTSVEVDEGDEDDDENGDDD